LLSIDQTDRGPFHRETGHAPDVRFDRATTEEREASIKIDALDRAVRSERTTVGGYP
jgi:hypothetical protein